MSIQKKTIYNILKLSIWLIIFTLTTEVAVRILGHLPLKERTFKIKQTAEQLTFIRTQPKPLNLESIEDNTADTLTHLAYASSVKYSYTLNTNGSRYCGKQYDTSLNDINIYGCSFTFGVGLEDSNTHPYILQQRINNYNINNYGKSGYGLVDIYFKIKKTLNSKVKIIIINYAHFLTDRYPGSRYWAKMKNIYLDKEIEQFLHKNVYLNNLIIDNEHHLKETKTYYPIFKKLPLQNKLACINLLDDKYNEVIDKRIYDKLQISYQILKEINILCKKNKIELIITNIDDYKRTSKDLAFFSPIGIKTLNMHVKNNNPRYNLMPYDSHPNTLANKLFAERMFLYLSENINLVSDKRPIFRQ